jgi:hypothetical protein
MCLRCSPRRCEGRAEGPIPPRIGGGRRIHVRSTPGLFRVELDDHQAVGLGKAAASPVDPDLVIFQGGSGDSCSSRAPTTAACTRRETPSFARSPDT